VSARTASSLLLILAGLSCAYYNGLYNANQLAKEARKAEREGRRGEARSLWAQASVKAESVAVRFRESKHRDDALLLQGLALSRTNSCRDAIAPLGEAVATSPDAALQIEAGLLQGQCYLRLGRADSAHRVLSGVIGAADSGLASQALWWRGRASMAMEAPEEALRDLQDTREPSALFDRALVFLDLGRSRDAAAALDSARALPFDEDLWDSALDRAGAVDVRVASDLVDRLLERVNLTSGQRGRLLLADAGRWDVVDPARAKRRLEAAVQAAGDSLEGRLATAQLDIGEIRRTTDIARLDPIAQELNTLMMDGGPVVGLAGPVTAVLERVTAELKAGGEEPQASPGASQAGPDLRLFLRAEEVRDSLAAFPLAARLFLHVRELYPSSVIAPKALLAAAALAGPGVADSLIEMALRDYPDSPYTLAALGRPTSEFTAVEDSLRRLQVTEATIPPREPGGGAGGERRDAPLAWPAHPAHTRPADHPPPRQPTPTW
jgi:tetratricopeptide (TPR) repeat protein